MSCNSDIAISKLLIKKQPIFNSIFSKKCCIVTYILLFVALPRIWKGHIALPLSVHPSGQVFVLVPFRKQQLYFASVCALGSIAGSTRIKMYPLLRNHCCSMYIFREMNPTLELKHSHSSVGDQFDPILCGPC